MMIAAGITLVSGCDRSPSANPVPSPAGETVIAKPVPSGRRGYEIPIPQLEYWDPERTTLKYSYEMRFDPPGIGESGPRLHRNGWAKAYYGSGLLEREGAYRFNPVTNQSDRVGTWTYYGTDGKPSRIEERGGDAIWTGPNQATPPPGAPEKGSTP